MMQAWRYFEYRVGRSNPQASARASYDAHGWLVDAQKRERCVW
jgi:hypothetical protein